MMPAKSPSTPSRKNSVKILFALAAGALLALPAQAETAADDCARARDPDRCAARQAALKACGEKRGIERRACLDASMPPVDCSKAQNPQQCEGAQKAKEVCKGKTDKALKKCLREERPKKKKKKRAKT
jgi:hypothetical protein